ncbi:unnamed protein product [Microthlaspi erraticum]|uniref:Arabidopsis retrotransposon Orf1 C-terminal domain-containing protein n=1 Tax=Microthlaspi erraticum TaxID=1685480 RepID=A0A6D2HJW1_9BRAS|nr:unnamed protein product [Microthlaspi erraticum]
MALQMKEGVRKLRVKRKEKRSWIFEDVELVLKNMQLGKFFSHRMESYKELTCEFLASMKHHEFDELDRAELDQGWGYITF